MPEAHGENEAGCRILRRHRALRALRHDLDDPPARVVEHAAATQLHGGSPRPSVALLRGERQLPGGIEGARGALTAESRSQRAELVLVERSQGAAPVQDPRKTATTHLQHNGHTVGLEVDEVVAHSGHRFYFLS